MRVALSLAVGLIVSLKATQAIATQPSTLAQTSSSQGFILPSGNIYCLLDDYGEQPFLRCEIASKLNPLPAQPRDRCELDWGGGLVLSTAGSPEVLCAGDTVYSSSYPTLAYGRTWQRNGFTCSAATTGLTCRNPAGREFFLSRRAWRTF